MPEAWDRKWSLAKPIPSASLVHAYGIGPMAQLVFYVAGVRPLGPGFKSILWEPMPGDLSWLNATFPVVGSNQLITVKWATLKSGARRFTLCCPGGIHVKTSRKYLNPEDEMTVKHC